jgi:hypothetical protein
VAEVGHVGESLIRRPLGSHSFHDMSHDQVLPPGQPH